MNPRIGDMVWVPSETYLRAEGPSFTKLETPKMLLVIGLPTPVQYDVIYKGQRWSVSREDTHYTQMSEEKNDNQVSRSL